MNKKIIVSLGSAMLLATSLMAVNSGCNISDSQQNTQKMMGQKQNSKKMMKQKYHGNSHIVGMMMKLNLSDEQKAKVKELMQKNMKNMPRTSDAFSETSFDKDLYIKISNEKRDNKIQNQANMIESIYKLLDDSQKKELKKILNKKPMMKNMANKPSPTMR